MYKKYYSRFLEANKGKLHFAAHSHHFWPDVTRQAMLDYWDDTALMVDDKWDKVFGEVVPQAQKYIAGLLSIDHPENVVFAPTTHELVYRLLSSLDKNNSVSILTTDSEFHSFSRQIKRTSENKNINVTYVSTEPFDTFEDRLIYEIKSKTFDMIVFSQVFFNSGFAVNNLEKIVASVENKETIIVIDGYHGFCAVPTNLTTIQNRIFYVGGGYKYVQSGESCCYMTIPENCNLRPEFTGWFADFDHLSGKQEGKVAYGNGAFRFWGSTFDPTGIYRMNAVFSLFKEIDLTVENIHSKIIQNQNIFISGLDAINHPVLKKSNILTPINTEHRGHFITFKTDEAGNMYQLLRKNGIITDYRNDRLRFGFGLYHDEEDISELISRIKSM